MLSTLSLLSSSSVVFVVASVSVDVVAVIGVVIAANFAFFV